MFAVVGMPVSPIDHNPSGPSASGRPGFVEDFKRFFLRGLATLLPTLITLVLVAWIWSFLSDKLGRYAGPIAINMIKWISAVVFRHPLELEWYHTYWFFGTEKTFVEQLVDGVSAIVLVYIVGVLVGNFIGRAAYRLGEVAAMRIPIIRAIYPAAKQITDFVISDKKTRPFRSSSVVAVSPHANDIWSIGLVTGPGLKPLSQSTGREMVTVFIPSSPTAFSGYVVVVPREKVIELPLSVEEAMRLLVSGGVIGPRESKGRPAAAADSRRPDPAESPGRPEPTIGGATGRPDAGGA